MRGGPFAPAAVLALIAGAAALPHLATAAEKPGRATEPLEAKLRSLEGEKLQLSDYRGRPVLLELWATWCQPCRQQEEIVRDLEPELEERGVTVLAVNQGEEEKVVQAFVEKHPTHAPIVLDRWQRIATQLEVGELPALAVLDADGVLVGLRLGVTSREELLALLGELGAGE